MKHHQVTNDDEGVTIPPKTHDVIDEQSLTHKYKKTNRTICKSWDWVLTNSTRTSETLEISVMLKSHGIGLDGWMDGTSLLPQLLQSSYISEIFHRSSTIMIYCSGSRRADDHYGV